MVQGGCDGDTFPLLDGYTGYGIWHVASYLGAGGGALPLLDGGHFQSCHFFLGHLQF